MKQGFPFYFFHAPKNPHTYVYPSTKLVFQQAGGLKLGEYNK